MDAPERVYSDFEARPGFFAKVIEGPYIGQWGVLTGITKDSLGNEIGLLKTRDDDDVILHVAYENLRPDHAGRR